MKTQILALFFCSIIITTAGGLNLYNAELVGQIAVGKESGKIGWLDGIAKMGLGPLPMAINDSKLYISDFFNNRINIYNLNLKYIDEISIINEKEPQTGFCMASKWSFDNEGNLIGVDNNLGLGLAKINNKGEVLFLFKTNQISESVWAEKIFFPYQDKILFYEGSGKNEKIKFIDKDGKIQDENNLTAQIDADNAASMKGILKTFAASDDGNTTKLRNFLNNKKLVLRNGRLLTGRLSDLREYYILLKTISKNKVVDKATSRASEPIDLIGRYDFIDFDDTDNSYWQSLNKKNILIFSRYGELLDYFTTDKLVMSKAIAPNGDIYFFRGRTELDANVFRIYKISCRW